MRPSRHPSRTAPLLAAAALSGCTMVGYPSPVMPPAPPGAAATAPAIAAPDRPADPGDLPREPLARSGNPDSYEVFGRTYRPLASAEGLEEEGLASWYGEEFEGKPTSSGEPFDPDLLTAAHRTIPIPSWVEVENLSNGRRVVVRVNDRGPFSDPDRRIIDVSRAAARELGMIGAGIVPVRVRVLVSPYPPDGSGGA